MSCIHLCLGQAGNQIGKEFWGLAEDEFFVEDGGGGGGGGGGPRRGARRSRPPSNMTGSKTTMHRQLLHPGGAAMFHEDGSARCLAVDSEPKVVQSFQGRVGSLRPENAIFSQSGLANNWAMGFESCRDNGDGRDGAEGGGLFQRCMEGVRKEAERSCWLNSLLMTHSLAGGTGSGLGSGVLQALRDEYPCLYLISVCVGPFGLGDTPLQHYNSALALHHLQAYADAIIYRGNDDLLLGAKASAASRRLSSEFTPTTGHATGGGGGGGGGGRWRPLGVPPTRASSGKVNVNGAVSTADMNASLSLDMGSYFFPTSRSVLLDPSYYRSGGGSGDAQPTPPLRLLLPTSAHRKSGSNVQETATPRPFDGGSLMAAACPIPSAKFVDLRSTLSVSSSSLSLVDAAGGARPQGSGRRKTGEWAALAVHLGRMAPLCPRKGGGQADDACIAAHHVVRGFVGGGGGGRGGEDRGRGVAENARSGSVIRRRSGDGGKVVGDASTAAMEAASTAVEGVSEEASEALRRHHECPQWRTATDVSSSPALRSRAVARSVTTVCNQTRIRGVFRHVLSRAEEKFKARAYLHWYYRHGLEEEDFLAAFEGVRTVQLGYDGLARALGSASGT